jgi:hypothetical protein
MERNAQRSYALALLALWASQEGADGDRPPLGWAFRHMTRQSIYHLPAHRLLPALLEHSPSPEVLTQQFMTALAWCGNPAVVALGEFFSPLYVPVILMLNIKSTL